MEKKRIISDRGHFLIKIDHDFWQRISSYVQGHYEKYSVEIVREQNVDLFKDMDEAYDCICKYTDTIKRIKVVAKDKENLLNLSIKNYRDITNLNNVELYAECAGFEIENGVRLEIKEQIEEHRVYRACIRVAGAIYVIILLNHLSDMLILNQYIAYPVFTSLLITMVDAVVIFYGIIPMIQRFVYGKNKIHFLTNYENIEKYRKKRKTDNIISTILLVIAVAIAVCIRIF